MLHHHTNNDVKILEKSREVKFYKNFITVWSNWTECGVNPDIVSQSRFCKNCLTDYPQVQTKSCPPGNCLC